MKKLDPAYVLPTRQGGHGHVKDMVAARYKGDKEKVVEEGEDSEHYESDMWTSINMDAHLAITGHYISESKQRLHYWSHGV